MTTITFYCKLCEKPFEIKMPSYLPECYGDMVSELVFFLHLVKHHLKEGKVLKQLFILLKYILKSVIVTNRYTSCSFSCYSFRLSTVNF